MQKKMNIVVSIPESEDHASLPENTVINATVSEISSAERKLPVSLKGDKLLLKISNDNLKMNTQDKT